GFAPGGGTPQRRRGPRHVRATARRLARRRLHGGADERKPGRGPDDWVCPPVTHAARPRHADHSPGQPTAGAGCLESPAMSTHVVEVGPNTIRQLCCGGEIVDDDGLERPPLKTMNDPDPFLPPGP